jgi:hypothetical protein
MRVCECAAVHQLLSALVQPRSKQRNGAQVRKRYHTPLTPYQRLLACPWLDEAIRTKLREQFAILDPVNLLKLIREAQHVLARYQGLEVTLPDACDATGFMESLSVAWNAGEVRPTHMWKALKPRAWRTRADPYEHSWPLLEAWLEDAPHATAK